MSSGIYINMDMPTFEQGLRTINVYADGVVTNYAEKTIATAISMPEKHGRLVDADALKDTLANLFEYCDGKVNWNDVICALLRAPTIVPAYEKDKEGME